MRISHDEKIDENGLRKFILYFIIVSSVLSENSYYLNQLNLRLSGC